MKGFFDDTQIKQYSFDDKIKWVFKQLIAILNPMILGETINTYTKTGKHSRMVKVREKIKLIEISPDNIKIAQDIAMPFKDVQLSVGNEEISISGTDFCYKFPPNNILMVWNRIKKI